MIMQQIVALFYCQKQKVLFHYQKTKSNSKFSILNPRFNQNFKNMKTTTRLSGGI